MYAAGCGTALVPKSYSISRDGAIVPSYLILNVILFIFLRNPESCIVISGERKIEAILEPANPVPADAFSCLYTIPSSHPECNTFSTPDRYPLKAADGLMPKVREYSQ